MDVEFGIQNVARPVNFSTSDSAESVEAAVEQAMNEGKPISLLDDKGRRIIVPAGALGYAMIGSETKHAVGFGAL